MKTLGLYLHIPFCKSKCLYCDFCSFPRPKEETVNAYVDALCRDLRRWGERCHGYTVDTLYLGGGTPTLLSEEQMTRVMQSVRDAFSLMPNAEITAECNPRTGGLAYFRHLRALGFNRLSIGLQSAHKGELKALGRTHTLDDFCRTAESAREAGFANLSADVMLGIPHQTKESYLDTLRALLALSPDHVSAYGLSVEEGTPFGRMGARLLLPDEEETREMYLLGARLLEQNGLLQYEISNFARKGYESRHNLKYWNSEEYLGLGPAAYSDLFGERFGNSRDLAAFLSGEDVTAERETPSREERLQEYVMLRLRLAEGIVEEDFSARFGVRFADRFADGLSPYLSRGLLLRTDKGYALSREGMLLSNAILSDLLDFSKV